MKETDAIIEALENGPSIVVPLVREVPAERRRSRPAPNRWSAHEHACHLADVHPLFFSRLDLMLAEDNPQIVPYIPSDREETLLAAMDLDEALGRFVEDRARLTARLRELTDEQWRRTARHEEYDRYSVMIMFRHLAMHDMLHAYRIEEILLAKSG